MRNTIDKLDANTIIDQLSYRRIQFSYKKSLVDIVLPVLKKYEGKKVTKHIETAVNKAFKDNEQYDVRCYLDYNYRKQCGAIRITSNQVYTQGSRVQLIPNDHHFTLKLAELTLMDDSQPVVGDVTDFNCRYTNEVYVKETLDEFFKAISATTRIVEQNNKLHNQFQQHIEEIEKNHKTLQFAFSH